MRRRLVALAVVGVAAAVAAMLAWSSSPNPASAPRPSQSPALVIVPGQPGESASVLPADRVQVPDGSAYNSVDAEFVRMMIPHHQQALEMAALAPTRAADPRIRAVADRIRVAQRTEIDVLRAWLKARSLAESTQDHHGMPGMQTAASLAALDAARGAAFDRMFVAMMSEHHQGAVQMAKGVLSAGRDGQLEQLATSTAHEQAVEITRMRELLP
jgi:uncharacterized protein (DUF305 family)